MVMCVGFGENLAPDRDPRSSVEGLVSSDLLPTDHIAADDIKAGDVALGLRRAFDLGSASILLVLFCIPMAIIALLVATTSRGGAFYSQTRVGRNGRPFNMHKFRSMCNGAHDMLDDDAELKALYVASDFKIDADIDSRITKLGRVLRKTSIDELPQLWNVIRGEMSIIGVRPIEPDQLALRPEYDQDLYRQLRPGITGLWQVKGRSNVDPVDRIALDREYVETWSPWNDAKIIFGTPLAVLRIHHTH